MRSYTWSRPPYIRESGYSRRPEHLEHMVNGSVLYSTSDEDSHTEVRGLALTEQDSVLSVTGSGCRTLALLTDGPRRVVSLDANPVQNHLLELKAAAMRLLGRPEFLDFIGFEPGLRPSRRDTYLELRESLSAEAMKFWDESQGAIEHGVLYSGAHERFYAQWIAPLIVAARRRQLRRMHEFVDVDTQSSYFEKYWLTPGWNRSARLLANPKLIRRLLDDPSYFARVSDPDALATHINEGLARTFRHHLSSDVDLFGLLCTGRYWDDHNVPYYLRPENYERVRAHLDALEVVTQPLHEHLSEQAHGTYSAFSLSDVSGWMSHDDLVTLLQGVCRSSGHGARVVFRDLFSETDVALVEKQTCLHHLRQLSLDLTERDRALVFALQAFEVVQ